MVCASANCLLAISPLKTYKPGSAKEPEHITDEIVGVVAKK